MDVAPTVNKHVAVLEPDDLRRYERLLGVCDRQMELLRRAEAAFEDAKIVALAVEHERARVWTEICATYRLPSEGGYTVDSAGRVFPM